MRDNIRRIISMVLALVMMLSFATSNVTIAAVKDGKWTIKKDSILGVNEDVGVSKKTKAVRATISLAEDGRLLEDLYLGDCTPSSAGEIVVNQSSNGWLEWTTKTGEPINVFRTKQEDEE